MPSAMSAVHSIPPEILQEIFLFAISSRICVTERRAPIPYSCRPIYRSSTSPYSISHVCGRWRDISINFPNLWTHLCIGSPKSLKLVFLVKEWINRSRSLPLHLALHEFKHCNTRLPPDVTKAVLSVFLDSFYRCKTFVLDIETPLDDLIDVRCMQIQCPVSLDCICLRILKSSRLASKLFLYKLLRASSLLSVWIFAPMLKLEEACTSWDNLQHLSIYDSIGEVHHLRQVLPHCGRLKSLEAYSWFSEPTRVDEIRLPYLERLTLKWVDFVSSFLTSLRVPALSELILHCDMPINDYFLVNMLKKSHATLKSLEINSVASDLGIVKMLQGSCFMELEVLVLTDSPVLFGRSKRISLVWPQVIALLTSWKSGTWQYLPFLQHFALRTQNTHDVVPGLATLVQSRLGVDPEIQQHSRLRVSSGSIDFSFTVPTK